MSARMQYSVFETSYNCPAKVAPIMVLVHPLIFFWRDSSSSASRYRCVHPGAVILRLWIRYCHEEALIIFTALIQQSMAVSQFAFSSVLVYSHTRSTSSVGAQVLFQFQVCISQVQSYSRQTRECSRCVLNPAVPPSLHQRRLVWTRDR